MIRGIHVGRGVVEVATIRSGCNRYELEDLYKMLNCDLVDIAVRKVNGQPFDFVCDDEGLFKEDQFVSVLSKTHGIDIVGDVFICSHNGASLIGLTDKQVEHIMDSVRKGMVITE